MGQKPQMYDTVLYMLLNNLVVDLRSTEISIMMNVDNEVSTIIKT